MKRRTRRRNTLKQLLRVDMVLEEEEHEEVSLLCRLFASLVKHEVDILHSLTIKLYT